MECVNNTTHKAETLTQADIEAARSLVHLRSAVSAGFGTSTAYLDYEEEEEEEEEEDHHRNSSNNSCSYSNSVQWKPKLMTKGCAGANVAVSSSEEVEDVLADIEDDERLRRRNKRYRYVEDLYNVTVPVAMGHHIPAAAVKGNKKKNNKFTKSH